MKTEKHTPEPWRLIHDEGDGKQSDVFSKDGFHWRYGIAGNYGPLKVANTMAVSQEEARANALLIAAAPELLEAAKLILIAFDYGSCGKNNALSESVDRLRAAIRKAEEGK